MRQRKNKKIVALLLTVCLTIGAFGSMVFAQEPNEEMSDTEITEDAEEVYEEEPLLEEMEEDGLSDDDTASQESTLPSGEDYPASLEAKMPSGEEQESDDAEETEDDFITFDEMVFVNPDYDGLISEDILLTEDDIEVSPIATYASENYETSIEKAGADLRASLEDRETQFTIKYLYPGNSIDSDGLAAVAWEMWDVALAHTGVSTEGDYMRWQYGGWTLSANAKKSSSGTYLDMKFTVTYYSTASEEKTVTNEIQKVLNQLNLGCKSDYERVKAIYDYICDNVTYDYAHLGNSSYTKQFTAYGALVDGTAVCQGYSVLLYRMLLEADVDCRVVTGNGNGEAHAWNIICVDGKYYNADSTWDAGKSSYSYFLLPDSGLSTHTRSEEFAASSFYAVYPMGTSAYTASNDTGASHHTSSGWVTTKAATCTEDGTRRQTCTVCGEVLAEETIAAYGHDYMTETTPASCDVDGHVVKICRRCDDTYVSEVLPASGHNYVENVVEPTCTEDGYTEFVCSVCGSSYQSDHVDPLGHNYDDGVNEIIYPCRYQSISYCACSRCGSFYVVDYVGLNERTMHNYSNGVCSTCGQIEGECDHIFERTTYIDGTCSETGYVEFACTECGEVQSYAIPITGNHDYQCVSSIEATCDHFGEEIYTCDECGKTYSNQIPQLNHDLFVAHTSDPTCTENGYIYYQCSLCEHEYEEYLEPFGHDYVEQDDGSFVCFRCGDTITDNGVVMDEDAEDASLGLYDITEAVVTGIEAHYVYTGEDIIPDVVVTYYGTVLTEGIDYELIFSHDREVGYASCAIVGIGDFYGEQIFHYTIDMTAYADGESETDDNEDSALNSDEDESEVEDDDQEFVWNQEKDQLEDESEDNEAADYWYENDAEYMKTRQSDPSYIDQYEYVDEYEYYENYTSQDAESGTEYRESGDEILGVEDSIPAQVILTILLATIYGIGFGIAINKRFKDYPV